MLLNCLNKTNVLLILFVCCQFYAQGQKSFLVSQDYGYPSITNYTPKEYGSHSQCWEMVQDEHGVFYSGNGEGLLRFDGKAWTKIQFPNFLQVREVIIDNEGKMYVGGAGDLGYINQEENGAFSFISLKHKLPDPYQDLISIQDIVSDGVDHIFLTRQNLYVYHSDEDRFSVLTDDSMFGRVWEVGDEVWVQSASRGMTRYEDGKLIPLEIQAYWPEGLLFDVFLWEPGKIMVLTSTGMYWIENGQKRRVEGNINDLLPNEYLENVLPLSDQSFLVSWISGIYQVGLEGNVINHIAESDGLADDHIHNMFQDKSGAVWASTNFGLSKLDYHLPLKKFDKRNGLIDIVNDILRWNDALYVSTHTGVFRYNPDENLAFQNVGPPIGESFELEIVDDELWVSTSNGLYAIDKNHNKRLIAEYTSYKFETAAKNPDIIYFTTTQGLFLIDRSNGKERLISFRDLVPDYIRYIEQDAQGNLWICSNSGRVMTLDFFNEGSIDEPTFRAFGPDDGLPMLHFPANLVDGELIFSSDKGIWDYENNRFEQSDRFPPYRNVVYTIREVSDGTIYVLHDNPPFMHVSTFTKEGDDFLPTNKTELKAVESPGLWAVFEDVDGSIWFGMTDGLLHYFPNQFQQKDSEGITNISKVIVGDDSVAYANVGTAINAPQISLPYDQNSLRFEYALISYDEVHNNEFSYRMVGLDEEWSSWSKEFIKEYEFLREGDYQFEVKGRDVYGNVSRASVVSIAINAPWYRSWWFLLTMLAISVSAIGLVVRYFSQRKLIRRVEELEMQQKVQKERERISSDLHDHVGAQLTSIISGLSMTEQVQDLPQQSDLRRLIDSLKQDAQTTMTNLRDSIWSLNSAAISTGELEDHIENFLEGYLKYQENLGYQIYNETSGVEKIGPAPALNLIRCIEESCQNIVKHARASKIEIIVKKSANAIAVQVKDDGIGFETAHVNGEHYGLENMKRRMKESEGNFAIESLKGAGTKVQFTVPYTL